MPCSLFDVCMLVLSGFVWTGLAYGSSFFIHTVNFKIGRYGFHFFDDPVKLFQAVKFHIGMKGVFPVAARDRERLQFAEVDAAFCNLRKHPGQAAARMIGAEIDGGFVGLLRLGGRLLLHHQKTGVVVFHGVDIWRNHVQLKQLCCQAAGDGCYVPAAALVNEFCAERGIFCFHQLPVVFIQKAKHCWMAMEWECTSLISSSVTPGFTSRFCLICR